MQKVIAVIPARSGSKRIKDKNIRDVGGKPLIYYQLKNALDVPEIDKVILATDSSKIADVALDIFGNNIYVIKRPPELCGDQSKTEDTLLYVLSLIPSDIVVTLEPTNPLNKPEYIRQCLHLIEERYDSACCVVDDYNFFLDDKEKLMERPMHQQIHPLLRETGNCWVTRTEILKATNNRLGGKIGTVVIPQRDSYHLDSEDDWKVIETLMEKKYYTKRETTTNYEKSYWARQPDPDGKVRDRTKEREKFLNNCKDELAYINQFSGRILDIGCGLGFLLSALSNGWEKHGVEVSQFAVAKADKYAVIRDTTYNYPDDYFNVVVMYNVIEHLGQPEKMIKEVRRILKPNGHLVLTTPDFESAVAQRFGNRFRLLHDKGHISLFGLLGLHSLLLDNLFEVEKITYPYFDTEYFTEENLMRLKDTTKVSPPAWGNMVSLYAHKK